MPATAGVPGSRPGAPGTASAPGMRWRRVFPGEERQLSSMRRWLLTLLPDGMARDDVIGVATELGSNAIKHTASGRGGWFAVEIVWHEHPAWVRLAVADGGAPDGPREIDDPLAENGRGLMLVRGLSARTGVSGDQRGRVVWAEIPWAVHAAAASPAHDPFEAAIREGMAALAVRFAGVPIWYGRSTMQWWALVAGDMLLTAPSPQELASLLHRRVAAGQPLVRPRVTRPAPEMDEPEWAARRPAWQPNIAVPLQFPHGHPTHPRAPAAAIAATSAVRRPPRPQRRIPPSARRAS
jgi:histidine kinase-like protein